MLREMFKETVVALLVVALVTLLLLANVLGNSATATNADNANKLGNKPASEYKTKGDFALITGTISVPTDGNHSSISINYPEGFNKDNCCVISKMFKRVDAPSTRGYSEGTVFMPDQNTSGNYPSKVELRSSDISIMVRYIYISSDGKIVTSEISTNTNFKIVLMKI